MKKSGLSYFWPSLTAHHQHLNTSINYFSKIFNVLFTFERERERERERDGVQVGEGQRERETQNLKQAPGSELSAVLSREL